MVRSQTRITTRQHLIDKTPLPTTLGRDSSVDCAMRTVSITHIIHRMHILVYNKSTLDKPNVQSRMENPGTRAT